MAYFHLYLIIRKHGEKRHFLPPNLSEERLREVVDAYEGKKSFILCGRVYYPSQIDKVTVFKSERKFRDLTLPNGKSPVGRGASVVARYFSRKQVEGVKTVTNQYFKSPPRESTESLRKPIDPKSVFIVHGLDFEPVNELKAILKELGLNPRVLKELPNRGMTIIEKLERYANVGYAFVLLTPDDVGSILVERLGKETFKFSKLALRARQNVILEFGYFIGRLGRDKVCCLYKGDVELPSDMHGIVYMPFQKSVNEVEGMILKELEDAGYKLPTDAKTIS
jgi:predicted nucleotide-binding protein